MSSHLWLDGLDAETIEVFANAFTISARKRGCRISTERFLASLPNKFKEQMARLCKDAQHNCKLCVNATDLPKVPLSDDWQEKICFSTCIENTLLKCATERTRLMTTTDLVTFLKLLCTTAVRLRAISISLDSYLTSDETVPCTMPSLVSMPTRWMRYPATVLSVDVPGDVVDIIMSKANSIEALRKCKAVSKAWRQAARYTLCNVAWLLANDYSIHDLLKKGNPSPQLVVAVAANRLNDVYERDGEGLLPLQFAAAYRMDASLIAALRLATAARPGTNSDEVRSIKSHLRPVRTRVGHNPIAA